MTVFRPVAGNALDWGSAGTWKDGAGVPTSGASNIVLIEAGRYNFTANLDQNAVNIAALIIQPGAEVYLPGLIIDINQTGGEGLVNYGVAGLIRMAGGTTNKVVSQSPGCKVRLEGGTHPVVHAAKGADVFGGSGATLEEMVADFATVEVEAKSDRIKVEIMNGGTLKTARSVEDGFLGENSTLIMRAAAAVTNGSGGGVVRVNGRNALLRMDHTSAVTHDIIRARAGKVDPSRCVVAPTFTYLYKSPGAKVIEKCLSGSITVTNRVTYGGDSELAAEDL